MNNYKLVEVTCKRCGYKWVPRVPDPRICPNCRSYRWDTPKGEEAGRKRRQPRLL